MRLNLNKINSFELRKEIGWLNSLVVGLYTLTDKDFAYQSYVSKHEDNCGTVCCAFGWMPKFVPESGVKWSIPISDNASMSVNVYKAFNTIYEIKEVEFISFMFCGGKYHHEIEKGLLGAYNSVKGANNKQFSVTDAFGDGYDATLKQVINRIETVILILSSNLYRKSRIKTNGTKSNRRFKNRGGLSGKTGGWS